MHIVCWSFTSPTVSSMPWELNMLGFLSDKTETLLRKWKRHLWKQRDSHMFSVTFALNLFKAQLTNIHLSLLLFTLPFGLGKWEHMRTHAHGLHARAASCLLCSLKPRHMGERQCGSASPWALMASCEGKPGKAVGLMLH